MAIYTCRQGVSQKGLVAQDDSASKPVISSYEAQKRVEIAWQSGTGRRSNFVLVISSHELAELAYHCHKILAATQPEPQKELKDYDIDELLVAIKAKTEE